MMLHRTARLAIDIVYSQNASHPEVSAFASLKQFVRFLAGLVLRASGASGTLCLIPPTCGTSAALGRAIPWVWWHVRPLIPSDQHANSQHSCTDIWLAERGCLGWEWLCRAQQQQRGPWQCIEA